GQVGSNIGGAGGSDARVLTPGERGTGKEVAATLIDAASGRAAHPLIAINCAGLAETLHTASAIRAADCVVILTDHSAFDYSLIARHAAAIVDTRNALSGCGAEVPVFRLGAGYQDRLPVAV